MGKIVEIENVERLEMMEEKYGISLDGVYAEYNIIDEDLQQISVRGEIQATDGTTIEEDLELTMTAYNRDGKVIATCSEHFYVDDFFGISPFDMFTDIIEKPTKIRIYPKKS